MMTEMTRYKQQMDVDDDSSSIGSARTEELPSGTTTVHYHMGSHWWRSRTGLEKSLLVGWLLLLGVVTVLVAVLHIQTVSLPSRSSGSNRMCLDPQCVELSGSVLRSMDRSADPCEDFYQYACGGWMKRNPIPVGKAIWGNLNRLASDNQMIIRNVLESKEKTESKAEEKARVFYRSCMDANKIIEKYKSKPLLPLLEVVMGGWSVSGNWSSENYTLEGDVIQSKIKLSSEAFFTWGVAEDDKNSSNHIIQFDQGGLMLPARDYYLNVSEKEVVDAYVEYITKVGVLLGGDEDVARAAAVDIVDLENQLAVITTPDEERRHNDNLYKSYTIDELNKLAPFMNWITFLNKAFLKVNRKLASSTMVVVYATDYLKNLSSILKNMTSTEKGKQTVHNYLVWHGIRGYLGFLSREYREAGRDLERAEAGVAGSEAAWRECVAATDASLGPAVGAMYIRQAFNKEAKAMAEEMINHVRHTFMESLESVKWMDNKTRKAAVMKAKAIMEMIGYPDYILNTGELDAKFADLNVTENKFFANNIAVTDFTVKENLKRLYKPVNKTRWDMTPPTVNAYYSPTRNDIVFPAGILQAPFFHRNNLQALNYGAVGVVMGHELAHAFDDQGRRYDHEGNMHQWWEEETVHKFKNLTKCMEDQYSAYDLGGQHLNGKLTLGENIADNGGLQASFQAYKEWVENHGPEASLPGLVLTNQQLFFLGFAQVWCSAITKEAAHLEILKDSHVPGQFRVLGTLSNSLDFSKAFSCQPGSRMNPQEKCHIW